MIDNNNILPTPPRAEELELQKANAGKFDLSRNWLDLQIQYPAPRYLLQYRGVGFFPLGGIQAITGQKKNGKTFLMCQLMAAILGEGESVRRMLPGLCADPETLESLDRKPVVLYCDTEMEIENTARAARRVHWLCDWPLDKGNDRFKVLWLRAEKADKKKGLSAAAVRWAKIKQAMAETKPTAVFLDGIRDIIGDFNDNKESAEIISELMAIATETQCCIVNVLHENPGSDKMRGHLGTELGNKATDTFACTKKKEGGIVTFTVKQEDARGKDVDDWTFEVTEDAGALGVPRVMGEVVVGDKPEKVYQILKEHASEIEWPATGRQIWSLFKAGGITNTIDQQADLNIAKNRRFILEQSKAQMEKGQRYPKYILNIEDDDKPF